MNRTTVFIALAGLTLWSSSWAKAQTVEFDFTSLPDVQAATWRSHATGPGATVPYNSLPMGGRVQVITASDETEAPASEHLRTWIQNVGPVPGSSTARYLEGLYHLSLPTLGTSGDWLRFEAEVGHSASHTLPPSTEPLGTALSNGMDFEVWLVTSSGERHLLSAVETRFDGQLTRMSADLTSFAGEFVDILLRVDSGPTDNNAAGDWGIWKQAEIVRYDATIPGNDGTYEAYDLAAAAQIMMPAVASTVEPPPPLSTWRDGFGVGHGATYIRDSSEMLPIDGSGFVLDQSAASLVTLSSVPPAKGWIMSPNDVTSSSDYSVTGRFQGVYVPRNALDTKLRVDVRLDVAAPTDVTFTLRALRPELTEHAPCVGAEATTVVETGQTEPSDGQSLSLNLTGWQGEWIALEIGMRMESMHSNVYGLIGSPVVEYVPPHVVIVDNEAGATSAERLRGVVDSLSSGDRPRELHLGSGTYSLTSTLQYQGSPSAPKPSLSFVGDPVAGTRIEHLVPTDDWDDQTSLLNVFYGGNVALRDLIIDNASPGNEATELPFTQGIIHQVRPALIGGPTAKTIVWEPAPGFPSFEHFITPYDPAVPTEGEGWSTLQGHPRESAAPFAFTHGGAHAQKVLDATKVPGTGIWHLVVRPSAGLVPGGLWSVVNHRNRNAIRVQNVGHCVVDNVWFQGTLAIPVQAKGAEKVLVRSSRFAPPVDPVDSGDRVISCTGTAIFTIGCVFGPEIVSSQFSYTADEICHNRPFAAILANEGTGPSTGSPGVWNYAVKRGHRRFEAGDLVWAFDESQGVADAEPHEVMAAVDHTIAGAAGPFQVLSFDHDITVNGEALESLPASGIGSTGDAFFLDAQRAPFSVFVGNEAKYGRAGVNLQGNDCVVADNHIERMNKNAVWHFTSTHEGFEGDRFIMAGNTIVNCATRNTAAIPERESHVPVFIGQTRVSSGTLPQASSAARFKDIVIRDNEIQGWPRHAVVLHACEDVLIAGNELSNDGFPEFVLDDGWRSLMLMDRCTGVELGEHVLLRDHRGSGDIDGRILVRQMNPLSDVSVTGPLAWDTPDLESGAVDVQLVFGTAPAVLSSPLFPMPSFNVLQFGDGPGNNNVFLHGSEMPMSLGLCVYEWDYDFDGITFDVDSVGQYVSVVIPGPATVKIALRVTCGNGTNITTREVTVN